MPNLKREFDSKTYTQALIAEKINCDTKRFDQNDQKQHRIGQLTRTHRSLIRTEKKRASEGLLSSPSENSLKSKQ